VLGSSQAAEDYSEFRDQAKQPKLDFQTNRRPTPCGGNAGLLIPSRSR
jgi:hypothetical protein